MSSSNSNPQSNSHAQWIRYSNRRCFCRPKAAIVVSMSEENPNRLYYTCRRDDPKRCSFFEWCEPDEPVMSAGEVEGRLNKLEEEVNNMVAIHVAEIESGQLEVQEELAKLQNELQDQLCSFKTIVENMNKEIEDNGSRFKAEHDLMVSKMDTEMSKTQKSLSNLKFLITFLTLVVIFTMWKMK